MSSAEPDALRFARYDFTNNLENDIQLAMFGRPQNDLQPLPRLDFLDPKFSNTAEPNANDDQEADIAYVKGEEAFLILAEAQLADGDLAPELSGRDEQDVLGHAGRRPPDRGRPGIIGTARGRPNPPFQKGLRTLPRPPPC